MIDFSDALPPRKMVKPRLDALILTCCPDCQGHMKRSREDGIFYCSTPCGGINSEDGLDPRDIQLEWDETWTVSEEDELIILHWEETVEE